MLFIGSLQKPIVLHEINDRIPLVIGLNAMKSLNIDVNEYETFINGYPVPFKVVTVDKIEFCSLSPKLVKQVCLTKSRIWAPNTSKAMTDKDLFLLHKPLGHANSKSLIQISSVNIGYFG